MKKVFLCLAVFAMSFSAIGQETEKKVLRHKGFETNRFVDNWEFTVLGGIQAFHANQGYNRVTGEWDPAALFQGLGDEIMPAACPLGGRVLYNSDHSPAQRECLCVLSCV